MSGHRYRNKRNVLGCRGSPTGGVLGGEMRREVTGAGFLRVTAEHDGGVCVLSVSGELDLLSAARFAEQTALAIDGRAERLVLDLSGLAFVDCCGARALAALTEAVPDGCPVIVRSARPVVRRMLELMGVDLQARRGKCGPGEPAGGGTAARRRRIVPHWVKVRPRGH